MNDFLTKLFPHRKRKVLLSDFRKEVKQLAKEHGKTYCSVNVESSEHFYKDGTAKRSMLFTCYVDGYGHFQADSISEAIKNLKNAMEVAKKPKNEIDVAIE
jgi:hypothetical protein